MKQGTKVLLDRAKSKSKKRVKSSFLSYGLCEESRKILINNIAKRVIREHKKAIDLLADK